MTNAVIDMSSAESRARHYKEITSLYSDNGFQRIKRHWVYQERAPLMRGVAVTSVIAGAVAGAATGKKAGELAVQTYFSDDLKDDDVKMQVGRYVGAVVGGTTGAAASLYLYIFLVERTNQFSNWKEMKISHALKEFITLNYSEDVILSQHCCAVSLFPMTIPARTPAGVYYDLEFILNCPRVVNQDHMIRDPLRNPNFSEDAIVIDFERGVLVNKRIRYLLRADVAQLGVDSPLRASLMQQIAEVDVIIKNHYESAKEVIEVKRRAEALTGNDYLTELGRFFAECGASIEHDLW